MNFRYGQQTRFTNFGYLTQSDKWILPRNVVVDSLLSMNITGYQNCLSFIPEWLLRHFFYRDLKGQLQIIKASSPKTPCATTKSYPKSAPAKPTGCVATSSASKKTALISISANKASQSTARAGRSLSPEMSSSTQPVSLVLIPISYLTRLSRLHMSPRLGIYKLSLPNFSASVRSIVCTSTPSAL